MEAGSLLENKLGSEDGILAESRFSSVLGEKDGTLLGMEEGELPGCEEGNAYGLFEGGIKLFVQMTLKFVWIVEGGGHSYISSSF